MRVCGSDAVDRLFEAQFVHEVRKTFAVFGQVDCVWRGAEDRDARLLQRVRELERGLAAELHDYTVKHAVFLLDAQDFHDVLKCERLEIEAVGGVIIC